MNKIIMNHMTHSHRTIRYSLMLLPISLLFTTSVLTASPITTAVTIVPVKHEQRVQQIRNSGRISHKTEIRLAFKIGGLIKQVNVEEGDEVSAGQILATLDLEEIDARQKRAASNYKKTDDNYIRFNTLYDKGLVSLQVKQNAQTARDSAEAELQITNFDRRLAVIRAPADGQILKRFVESDELIQPGQPVLLIASSQQGSVVRVGLIDQDIVKVKRGDPVDILLDAYPGRKFKGLVSEVALGTNSDVGTFEVEISIDDQGFVLRSGLIARVAIMPASSQFKYYIPVESVAATVNGYARIFILDESKNVANEVSVKIEEFLPDEVIVQGSLKPTDKVIRFGAPYLTDGSMVAIVAAR